MGYWKGLTPSSHTKEEYWKNYRNTDDFDGSISVIFQLLWLSAPIWVPLAIIFYFLLPTYEFKCWDRTSSGDKNLKIEYSHWVWSDNVDGTIKYQEDIPNSEGYYRIDTKFTGKIVGSQINYKLEKNKMEGTWPLDSVEINKNGTFYLLSDTSISYDGMTATKNGALGVEL